MNVPCQSSAKTVIKWGTWRRTVPVTKSTGTLAQTPEHIADELQDGLGGLQQSSEVLIRKPANGNKIYQLKELVQAVPIEWTTDSCRGGLDDSGSQIAAALGLELNPQECLIPAPQPLHVTGAGTSVIERGEKGKRGSATLSVWSPEGISSMRCTDLFIPPGISARNAVFNTPRVFALYFN